MQQALAPALRAVPFGRVSKGGKRLQPGQSYPTVSSPAEDVYGPLRTGSRSESDPCDPNSSENARRPQSTEPTNGAQRLTERTSGDEANDDHPDPPMGSPEAPDTEVCQHLVDWDA